jgi:hypothetical protein
MKYTFTNDEMNRMMYILRNLVAQQVLDGWNHDGLGGITVPPIDNPYGFNDVDLLNKILDQRAT